MTRQLDMEPLKFVKCLKTDCDGITDAKGVCSKNPLHISWKAIPLNEGK